MVCYLKLIYKILILDEKHIVKIQENPKKIQKNAFQKSYKLICILMSEISIWSPINEQDFWLPDVFYTGKELRLGALS